MKTSPLLRTGLISSWGRFWFTPSDPIGLYLVRFAAGLLFLAWLLTSLGHVSEFYSMQGWFDEQAFRDAARQADRTPEPITWSLVYLFGKSPGLLNVLYGLSLISVALFTLGVATRLTGVLTWLAVLSFVCNPAIFYDGEHLLIILAFYLMLGHLLFGLWNGPRTRWALLLGDSNGLIWKWRSQDVENIQPSIAANLTLRLLQVHFAIVVVTSGLHKLQFADWWAGNGFWYPLHPPMSMTPEQLKAESAHAWLTLFVLSLAQYLMLAWQLGFPFLAWNRACRPILLGGALIGWVGSIWLYGLPLFGPVFVIAAMSYITPEEWRSVGNFFSSLLGGRRVSLAKASKIPAPPNPLAQGGRSPTKPIGGRIRQSD